MNRGLDGGAMSKAKFNVGKEETALLKQFPQPQIMIRNRHLVPLGGLAASSIYLTIASICQVLPDAKPILGMNVAYYVPPSELSFSKPDFTYRVCKVSLEKQYLPKRSLYCSCDF